MLYFFNLILLKRAMGWNKAYKEMHTKSQYRNNKECKAKRNLALKIITTIPISTTTGQKKR